MSRHWMTLNRILAFLPRRGRRSNRHCVHSKFFRLPEMAVRPFVVSVEGNVGSGKSTFLEHFRDMAHVEICPEPVEVWRNWHGTNMLQLLFEDRKRWTYTFQSLVQLTRLDILTQRTSARVKIIERSLQSNRFVYVETGRLSGTLSHPEYKLLTSWYETLTKHTDINVDLIVYLRTNPCVAFERVRARGRPEEAGVQLPYMETLHSLYDAWLMDPQLEIPLIVIDADQPENAIRDAFEVHKNQIIGPAITP